MLYIDAKYAQILGSRLRNFKQKKDYLWNYSCPVCGDSSRNKLKARGYIYRQKSDLFCKCHNCSYGTNLGNLIKYVDSHLYDQYVLERYKEGARPQNSHKDISTFVNDTKAPEGIERHIELSDDVLSPLLRVDSLKSDHPVAKWVEKRLIPKDKWNLLYLAPKFKAFTNTVVPKFQEPIKDDHPRLIIPFFNRHGKVIAFQARSFGKEEPKYYTIKIDEECERIYGIDRVDFSKRIYVVEGPIDSLFLPNCIAVSGSSFDSPTLRQIMTNATIVMDNEPRNKEIVRILDKNIELGYNVCMFPDTVKQKDINDMIVAGNSTEEILSIIDNNTHHGIEAKLEYSTWKKI